MIKYNKADFFVLQNKFNRRITELSCICALQHCLQQGFHWRALSL